MRVSDEGTFVSCGNGPYLSIGEVAGTAVTLGQDDDEVQIAEASSGTLGPYQVRVLSVEGSTVMLEIDPPAG